MKKRKKTLKIPPCRGKITTYFLKLKNGIILFVTEKNTQKLRSKLLLSSFRGGTVVKNPPANAGDVGSSPGPGKSHMPWSN